MNRRLVLAWALVAGPAAAQRLGARVAAAPDGIVRLSFAARPGVCGDGRNVIALECVGGKCGRGGRGRTITFDGAFDGGEVEYDCEPGPVRISLTIRTGRTPIRASLQSATTRGIFCGRRRKSTTWWCSR